MIEIIFPKDQEEGTTSVVSKWLKQPGETLEAHQPVAEIETDKVVLEVAAPEDGVLQEILKLEGSEVAAGEVLATMKTTAAQKQTQSPLNNGETPPTSAVPVSQQSVRSGPAVRRLIQQHQLNPQLISATGKGGRITKKDVLEYIQIHSTTSPPEHTASQLNSQSVSEKPVLTSFPVSAGPIPAQVVPHSSMRKKIAQHMVQSLLHTAPHVTSVFEADMSAVIRHREAHKQEFQSKGVKLTYTAYFVAAAVKAIEHVPEVNSRFHEDHLEVFTDINIGVGTALEDKGLIVPVLHQAQNHNLMGVASGLQRMTEKARTGALKPADTQNGTFTISNYGVSGSLVATPIIINQPQSSIMGIGKMQKRVVVKELDGEDVMCIRPMTYVSLTIDHRVLDGHQTNTFLAKLVEVINHWE